MSRPNALGQQKTTGEGTAPRPKKQQQQEWWEVEPSTTEKTTAATSGPFSTGNNGPSDNKLPPSLAHQATAASATNDTSVLDPCATASGEDDSSNTTSNTCVFLPTAASEPGGKGQNDQRRGNNWQQQPSHQKRLEAVEEEEQAGSARVPAFNFSFAMGGWLMVYNFGVAKCLLDHGLHTVHPQQCVIGSSAGSLAAAALVLEADIDQIVEQVKASFIPRAHAAKIFGLVYGMFHIGTYLRESMLDCLPVERVADKLHPGRLIVVMATLLGWNSVRASDIKTGEELVDALRCSCAVFPMVMPHKFRGKRCFDGVFAEGTTSPMLSEEEARGLQTITISPLYASRASIKPSRYVPLSWIALPPSDPDAIDWLYDLGYRDALFWMAKEGIEHTCAHEFPGLRQEDENTSTDSVDIAGRRTSRSSSNDKNKNGSSKCVDDVNNTTHNAIRNSRVQEDDARKTKLRSPSPLSALSSSSSSSSPMSPSPSLPSTLPACETIATTATKKWIRRSKNKEDSYLRSSFVLSGCHLRPRRHKHPELDAETFVPTLRHFVGHGTYHGALDLVFVIFFSFVWKPTVALLIYIDLSVRFWLAVCRGVIKELRSVLWWVAPALTILVVATRNDEAAMPSRNDLLCVAAGLGAIVFFRGRKDGSLSEGEWRRARRILNGLLEYRILLRCLPWGHRHAVQSEVLESSLLYRASSFFM